VAGLTLANLAISSLTIFSMGHFLLAALMVVLTNTCRTSLKHKYHCVKWPELCHPKAQVLWV
jgi:hypothetical protein